MMQLATIFLTDAPPPPPEVVFPGDPNGKILTLELFYPGEHRPQCSELHILGKKIMWWFPVTFHIAVQVTMTTPEDDVKLPYQSP
jgi:hypothetical protein